MSTLRTFLSIIDLQCLLRSEFYYDRVVLKSAGRGLIAGRYSGNFG